jgi:hypothetical protein
VKADISGPLTFAVIFAALFAYRLWKSPWTAGSAGSPPRAEKAAGRVARWREDGSQTGAWR